MTLDEAIAKAKKALERQNLSDLCRENFKQLAEWLEELKQYREQYKEQNQETNLDHYKRKILEDCMWNLAIVEGKPKRCDRTSCSNCDFNKDRSKRCHEKAMEWLEQPYKNSAIKLTKFENDLLQSYLKSSLLSGYEFKSIVILKRMKEKGYFKGVDEDATIEDILANSEITEEE